MFPVFKPCIFVCGVFCFVVCFFFFFCPLEVRKSVFVVVGN